MPEDLPDAVLIRTCKSDVHGPQGRASFRELAERYAPLLFGYLRAFALDETEVDEVAQEVLVLLYRDFAHGGPDRSIRPWLAHTARRRVQARLDAKGGSPAVGLADLRLPEGAAGDAASTKERRWWESLGRLPDTEREILFLRQVGGLSYENAAEIYEMTSGTVRDLAHQTLVRLSDAVGE